jgi:hypothetical protein
MLEQVINRIVLFAGVGATSMAITGAIEGVVTGAIFHIVLQGPYMGSLRWLLGRGFSAVEEASVAGGVIGALFGFLSFGSIAVLSPHLSSVVFLRRLIKAGALGTLAGVILGAVGGASTVSFLTWLLMSQDIYIRGGLWWPVSTPPAPKAWILAESALFGYVWGVVLGFCTGLFYGLSVTSKKDVRPEGAELDL